MAECSDTINTVVVAGPRFANSTKRCPFYTSMDHAVIDGDSARMGFVDDVIDLLLIAGEYVDGQGVLQTRGEDFSQLVTAPYERSGSTLPIYITNCIFRFSSDKWQNWAKKLLRHGRVCIRLWSAAFRVVLIVKYLSS